jgi:hypothetical protein
MKNLPYAPPFPLPAYFRKRTVMFAAYGSSPVRISKVDVLE